MKKVKKTHLVTNNEENFILEALEENLRIDGRTQNEYRSVEIKFDQQFGQCLVSIGKTKVLSIVTCEVVEPYPERPNEGFLFFNVDLSPMSSEQFDSSKISEQSIEMGRIIERSLKGSKAIDTEALCIIARKKVWSLRVDIHIIDHYGNLIDAAHLAAIASLLHFKRPEVTIQGEEFKIHSLQERNAVPLSIHHIPICVTFGLFQGGLFVVDPDIKESTISQGTMTIAVNTHSEICGVQKGGGVPIEMDQILNCTKIAAQKAQEITKKLKEALNQDENERKQISVPEYAKNRENLSVKNVEISDDEVDEIISESSEEEEEEKKEIEKEDSDEEISKSKKTKKPIKNQIVLDDEDLMDEEPKEIFKKEVQQFQKEHKSVKNIEEDDVIEIKKEVKKKPEPKKKEILKKNENIDLTAAIKKKK